MLNTDEEIRKVWGSHIPLTKAFMELIPPQTVIECGCGHYSTPMFKDVPSHHIVEHDTKWAEIIYPQYPKATWIVDKIPLVEKRYLRPGDFERIQELYRGYKYGSLPKTDLLFVDTVACARVTAANTLAPLAQAVIVHDTSPWSCPFYQYEELNLRAEFFQYELRPTGNVNGHKIEWTTLFHRHALALDVWREKINIHALELWGQGADFEEVKK